MLSYYFSLALRSFRSHPALSSLMVLAVALGIGACMSTLTIYYVLSGDPIPAKSARLVNVQVEARDLKGYMPGEDILLQPTRFDAESLLREKKAKRQVMMTAGGVRVIPATGQGKPLISSARFASADFFPMFDVPLLYGRAWDASEDASQARVLVLSDSMNKRLFDGENSVGKTLHLNNSDFRVIGVLAPWRAVPHFFDLTEGAYADSEDIYLPFSTSIDLDFGASGSFWCWGDTQWKPRALNAPCGWIQYWAELEQADQLPAYRDYLFQYSELQRRAGRFERPSRVAATPVMPWLTANKVLPSDVRLQLWIAFGFLLVCLVNTVGLLLSKCLRRSGDIGIRRALGASRRDIFGQYLVEAGVTGLAGGLLGLGLAWLGLWLVRQSPSAYAPLAQMDLSMLALTFALSLIASLAAGLLPAWRAASIAPALQLKAA